MNVLFVNTSDAAGGAAIAARRLQHALIQQKLGIKMLVREKTTDDDNIVALNSRTAWLKFVLERGEIWLRNRSRKRLWQLDTGRWGLDITQTPEYEAADLIHLHWINQTMLSLSVLEKILSSQKPVVWTLHDMWPLTGVCHHAERCDKWQTHCQSCPQLAHPHAHDMSYGTFERKLKTYAGKNLTFVACSHWLRDLALKARLTQGHCIESIPNPIDTSFFTPGNKREARRLLGLPQDKKLLLFVAFKANDKNKGIDYLIESTHIIARDFPEIAAQMAVVPTGHNGDELQTAFGCQCLPQGYVHEPERMLLLYRAADLLVMPTLMDNLPNVIAEAQSAGLPCVGFHIGGLPQMIRDGHNGYLTRYKDADDFAQTVLHTLTSDLYRQMCINACATAVEMYSEQSVSQRYIQLYRRVLGQDAPPDSSPL